MMKKLLLILFCFPVLCLHAQSDIAIGEWISYLPYNLGAHLAQSDEKIYYGTPFSILTLDKEDGSVEFVSKVDGLSETGIQDLAYDPFNRQLIIAYDNSIIDIVSGSEVFSIDNIKETDFIQGDKNIYDIFVQNETYAYFATGFGVVEYNLAKLEFGFTLDAQQRVDGIDGNEDFLLIDAQDGVYYFDLTVPTPNFFGSWVMVEEGLPNNYDAADVMMRNSRSYILLDNGVWASDNFDDYQPIYSFDDNEYEAIFLEPAGDGWMLGLKSFNSNTSKLVIFDNADSPVDEITDCISRMSGAMMAEDGTIYFADDFEGIRIKESDGNCRVLEFNAPKSAEASDIDIRDDVVYIASGGVSETLGNLFGRNGFYKLKDGSWTNYHENTSNFIKNNDLIQLYAIAAHPVEDKVYIGSFWGGLIEFNPEEESFILYNKDNSPLQSPIGDNPLRVKISGLAFDNDNNLWMSNFETQEPLVVLTGEGNWHSFAVPSDNKLADLAVDQAGYIWAVIGGNTGGVVVYDPGQSIADPTDNPAPVFKNQSNSEVPSNIVNSIAVDLDGAVWVGTAEGVVVFECGGSATESVCVGNKRKVLQDSIAAFLLQTEDVLSIAVDGANRKWFGTRNGIFVQSPSGEDQVAFFDTDNSPLFDNTITAMEYNPNTGEMFIATNKGIQAYRTETAGSRATHASNVYAFPNPVRPEYSGPIAIKGLARDAEVKITDVDGQLVFQTEALGGQAIWDGRDINGRAVSGGVYLVFSSSTDSFRDPNTYVTKILLIR